jgi:hypothetical protein
MWIVDKLIGTSDRSIARSLVNEEGVRIAQTAERELSVTNISTARSGSTSLRVDMTSQMVILQTT